MELAQLSDRGTRSPRLELPRPGTGFALVLALVITHTIAWRAPQPASAASSPSAAKQVRASNAPARRELGVTIIPIGCGMKPTDNIRTIVFPIGTEVIVIRICLPHQREN